MNLEETKGYVKHRLGVAGRKEPLFKEEALKLLHSRSGGIPRRINQIADMALFVGASQKKRLIDRAGVEEAIRSLEG
ncbi:MAG: hypothetical protein HY609_00635 [Deltaproteobacteria bacterium]|nr:hypothetical protein [Deltaproteobacteria bacterium]